MVFCLVERERPKSVPFWFAMINRLCRHLFPVEWYTFFFFPSQRITPKSPLLRSLGQSWAGQPLGIPYYSYWIVPPGLTDITTTACTITRFTQHLHVHTVNVHELITCHCQDTTTNTIKCVRWVGTPAHPGACSSSNGYRQHAATLLSLIHISEPTRPY